MTCSVPACSRVPHPRPGWKKSLSIMLTLNATSHEPHRFSASMVATGREPTLPPDVQQDAHTSPSVDDPADYVEVLTQRLKLTHQQMASPSLPAVANPYQEGSLIYTMTTPPELSNKLTPHWKGPFRVRRIPNEYQVVYKDGSMWRTVHINHTKPAKFTAPDLPEPVPAPETSRPPFGYLPSGLLGPRPPPPAAASPAEGSSSSPTASVPAQPPAAPAASEMQPPATAPASQQPESAFRPRRSPRLNPEPGRVCTIKGPPGNPSPQSEKSTTMARTYPLTVPYNQCLGARTDRLSFSSLYLEDLKNGESQYLSSMKQLVDALPKMENPSSRFALRGHVARSGQKRLRHSMRAAMWWLLPSDGEFCRSFHSLQYYLTCQGRRVALRGGDVTLLLLESYLNWVADPMPPPTRRLAGLTSPASSENTPPADGSRKLPRRLRPHRRRGKQPAVSANENAASCVADPATSLRPSANENSAPRAATQQRSMTNRNSPFSGPQPGTSRALVKHPQTFQYPQHPQHPRSTTNQNAERRSRLDHPEIRGVYKPAQHSIRQDSPASRLRDTFSGIGLSSPVLQQPTHKPTHKPFSRSPPGALMNDPLREAREAGRWRPGIVYPLPHAAHPDTRLLIDAAQPESAALSHAERPPTVLDIAEAGPVGETRCPGPSQQRGSRSPRRQSRRRPRNCSSGVFKPKKRSPHHGHWCE